jgi:drug/metabolite transporter (DMT)-like permease
MGNLTGKQAVSFTAFYLEPWFAYTIVLGALFISIFLCIGLTAQKLGVSVSMLAAKLSVVIPVSIAVFLYNEPVSFLKISGIILSLVAVYLISKKDEVLQLHPLYILLPVAVFAGSGMIDTLLKHVERNYIPPADASAIITTVFLMAAIIGSFSLFVIKLTGKKVVFTQREMLWGLMLGVPNYFSMYFLVLTLNQFAEASQIFPINNIGIAAASTLLGVFAFHEKISKLNLAGIILAIVAIVIISLA